MNGLLPVFDLAKQHLQALDDARKSGNYQIEQTAIEHLRRILEGVEQTGYDEEYVELVEEIREVLKA